MQIRKLVASTAVYVFIYFFWSAVDSLAQGLEIIYILMNFLNIPFFFFRLVYRHGPISDKATGEKFVSRLARH